MSHIDVATLAAAMDQTLLKPTVGPAAGHAWIAANADHGFASLCVSPFLVDAAAELLAISGTAVCSVCGFPLGYSTSAAKADEARDLVRRGCIEVDMVMNFAALLDGDHALVERDVRAVVDAVRDAGEGRCLVKVILETGHLSDDLIARGSEIAVTAGADFVKTSTGFGPRGASAADVRIMRATVGPDIGIKAAGGIRDLATALVMLDAGADRLGTSAGLEILAEADAAGM